MSKKIITLAIVVVSFFLLSGCLLKDKITNQIKKFGHEFLENESLEEEAREATMSGSHEFLELGPQENHSIDK